eukprot:TRINITY_DN1481_c0_g1_i4.p2 TRINITY_DN1481_c0_g1~~TRINITY_DN1481_c0_g1_i4.p2  ORF type:complete len:116 (-),score=14.15 TRINITY_DN1481_c0_g1_i4:465-812(-)
MGTPAYLTPIPMEPQMHMSASLQSLYAELQTLKYEVTGSSGINAEYFFFFFFFFFCPSFKFYYLSQKKTFHFPSIYSNHRSLMILDGPAPCSYKSLRVPNINKRTKTAAINSAGR